MTDRRQPAGITWHRRFPRAPRLYLIVQRAVLVACLMAVLPLGSLVPRTEARSLPGGISKVVPFVGVLVGWNHRNRIYRSAERFIDDRNEYYDGLRETARRQLANRELLGLRPSQVAAYVRVVALLEQHRSVELQVAEDRKRGARAEFNQRLEAAAFYALAGSRFAQQLIGAVQNGVGSAQSALDRVLNTLTNGSTAGLQDLQRIRNIAQQVSLASGAIGGRAGSDLRQAADHIIQAIDRPQAEAQAAIEKVQSELANLSQTLDSLSQIGRTPSAGAVAENLITRFLPGSVQSSDVSLDAISALLSQLEVGDGSLKDEARGALREGFVARCAAFAEAYQANLSALQSGTSTDGGQGTGAAQCTPVRQGDLTRRAETDRSNATAVAAPTSEPTEEVLPRVSAEGSFTEQYAGSANPGPPMATNFTLMADFASGTVSGTLNGGRTVTDVPIPCGTEEVILDTAYGAYRASYTAQFSTSLDPESGDFSAAIAPAGSCSANYSRPFTVEGCTQFNDQPLPGCNPWAGQGTITGFAKKDGYIEFTTQWVTGGGGSASGSWSGGGTVTKP